MENEFAKVMSERSDEELIRIVTVERDKYQKAAIEAAEWEVERRKIDIATYEEVTKKAITTRVAREKVDSNVVGSGIRFFNFLIDLLIYIILSMLVIFLVEVVFQPTEDTYTSLLGSILFFGTFISYYAVMEIKFQKTVGKFVTKTRVVKRDGTKPGTSDIITRTFCRFIPFDRISFLFVRNGIHDFLSNTKVIRDQAEERTKADTV